MDWHFITGEYPPNSGGVSDYTHLLVTALAAEGETVHVWCPGDGGDTAESGRVVVHRDLGRIGPADLGRAGRKLDRISGPKRLLVQWVPQSYRYSSMNLWFCLWIWRRAWFRQDRVEIMIHEPFLAFGEGSGKQDLAAAVHRVMLIILLHSASCVWVSIPDWATRLRPFLLARKTPFRWLPVPSNIPVIEDPGQVAELRARYAHPEVLLVGHFGAYDDYMLALMLEILPRLLLETTSASFLLIGKGSQGVRDRLIQQYPHLSERVRSTGPLPATDLSLHINLCAVMLQPYQDGISGRRGSTMAPLAHGVPVVTNVGKATEECWLESGAVRLAEVGDVDGLIDSVRCLLADEAARIALGKRAIEFYRKQFALRNTISALRGIDLNNSFADSLAISA